MNGAISVGQMERPWAKRTSVVIAGCSSLVFLLTLYPSNVLDAYFNYQLVVAHAFAGGLMVVSLSLLRRSGLNPVKVETRDWAYRVGSKILSRIMFCIFALGLLFLFVSLFGDAITRTEISPQLSSTVFESSLASVSEFIRFYFTGNAVFAALQLVGALSYFAYTLPLGLLAWRQASGVNLIALEKLEDKSAKEIAQMVAQRFYRRLLIFGFLILTTVVLWVPLTRVSFPSNNGTILFLFFGTIGYGLWVFAFGMFNQAFMIRLLKRTKAGSRANQLGEELQNQFLKLSITGSAMLMLTLLIPTTTSWDGFYLMIFAIFGGGIILLSLHLSVFRSIKQFGKIQ